MNDITRSRHGFQPNPLILNLANIFISSNPPRRLESNWCRLYTVEAV